MSKWLQNAYLCQKKAARHDEFELKSVYQDYYFLTCIRLTTTL